MRAAGFFREARRFLAEWWFQFGMLAHPLVEFCKKIMFLPGHWVLRLWKPALLVSVFSYLAARDERDYRGSFAGATFFGLLSLSIAVFYFGAVVLLGFAWPALVAVHALYFSPALALILGVWAACRASDRLYGKSPAGWWRRKRNEARVAAAAALARGRERLATWVARAARRARVELVNWAHYLRFVAGRRARRLASRLGFPA